MGKAGKRKQNKSLTIQVTGEQGEVFDAQMDVDKKMFERTNVCVCFRPQIPGEWNEYQMLGHEPPILGPIGGGSPGFLAEQCTWTAVVDVGRAERIAKGEKIGKPSGLRIRMRCVPILSADELAIYGEMAQQYALYLVELMHGQGSQP
jgi:hypothetical protein